MHTIRENALAFVAGRPVAEIVQASEEIYDELMADRIWAGTRALAQQHLDAGQRVWLVTATPVELASIIAHRLGLTGALGTVAEVVDGKYTGRLVGELMHGPAKAEAVLALAEREGLDLPRCTAYSDSANDLPMLSLTGTAVAVNPDTELRAIARGARLGRSATSAPAARRRRSACPTVARGRRSSRRRSSAARLAAADGRDEVPPGAPTRAVSRRRSCAAAAAGRASAGWSRGPGRSG